MTSPFQAAVAAAQDVLTAFAGEPVVYHRGADKVAITAVKGQTQVDTFDDHDRPFRVRYQDFLIDPGELLISGQPIKPKRGDKIKQTVGVDVHVFEVTSGPDNEVWRYSDTFAGRIRVHTEYLKTE